MSDWWAMHRQATVKHFYWFTVGKVKLVNSQP